ncbi:glycosyltransferase family 31 protein [Calycina marina]|uniref:Glycosyltransferase family 31 protein n=1 Tax=Calycina marina TaxID=1763456 RepID=A0A9P7YVZ8_9HELO|nr:glycosyltransferase family 31 protein [Calycina marina]
MPPRRFILLGISLALVTVLLIAIRHAYPPLNTNIVATKAKTKDQVTSCTQHLGWLIPYQFAYPIQYVSRDIVARVRADHARPQLTIIDKPLFEEFTTLNLADSNTFKFERCLPPLELEVPHGMHMPVDASNMMFGVQTTIGRLRDTIKHMERWLPNTNARLFAIVQQSEGIPANVEEMAALEKEFRSKKMLVSVIHPVRPTDSFPQRYFSLANVMFAAKDDKTQWIINIDDDTFFPSMWELQEELKKHDASKPLYIGSLSEDWWAVTKYGLMGFGGAGLILSTPMAAIIDANTEPCKDHLGTSAGDITMMDCVYKHSTTKLTHITSLHQVDMKGDLSGFYESGRDMLSVHHWKEGSQAGYKLEMEKMHQVADICDSCFLQRWQFPGELVLSNGFSIASYPEGHLTGKKPGVTGTVKDAVGVEPINKINLVQMEATWNDEINVLHSLAPTREKMKENEKIGYKLLDSMSVPGDEIGYPGQKVIRQIYFKEGSEAGVTGKDTVLVLNWMSGGLDPLPPVNPEIPNVKGRKLS